MILLTSEINVYKPCNCCFKKFLEINPCRKWGFLLSANHPRHRSEFSMTPDTWMFLSQSQFLKNKEQDGDNYECY